MGADEPRTRDPDAAPVTIRDVADRVSYHRLTTDARDTIRWSGVSIADYVRHHNPDGQWSGDRCGCTDDRCISYHHDEGQDCGCLPVVLERFTSERAKES